MIDGENDPLDGFFDGPAEPTPEHVPEPVAVQETATPEPQPAADPEEAVPEPKAGERVVPLSALEAERGKRKDYKGQFERADEQAKAHLTRAEQAELRVKDLEARLQAPPQPAPTPHAPAARPEPVRLPNPVEDPDAYAAAIRQQLSENLFNERLDISETQYLEANPGADTKAIAKRFVQEAAKNPALQAQLRVQPHPYEFAAKTLARLDAIAQIGDPVSYAEKLREQHRAEFEAEFAARQSGQPLPVAVPAAPKPITQFPASLANARNAAPGAVPPTAEDLSDLSSMVPKR